MFAYLDETHGGADKTLTAVAAYLFDAAGKDRFAEHYRETIEPLIPLDKRGRRHFHASPCFERNKPYQDLERPERERILALMAGAIRETALLGVVVGVTSEDYAAGITGKYIGLRLNRAKVANLAPYVGAPYTLCLLRCISGISDWLNKRGLAADVHYTIEAGDRSQAEAIRLLDALAVSKFASKLRFAGHTFVPKSSETPWLYAADYFAWVWQKNDRLSAGQDAQIGDWQSPVLPLIESTPHLASYLSDKSVNVQALVNFSNGLLRPRSTK